MSEIWRQEKITYRLEVVVNYILIEMVHRYSNMQLVLESMFTSLDRDCGSKIEIVSD